jgi:hypothetical protein
MMTMIAITHLLCVDRLEALLCLVVMVALKFIIEWLVAEYVALRMAFVVLTVVNKIGNTEVDSEAI